MEPRAELQTSPTLLGRLRRDPTDQAAWTTFVERYGGKIYGWCRHWGLQAADAQDVTQNVLLLLAQKLGTFDYDPSRSFRGWLKTLTHHAWSDFVARQQRPGRGSTDSEIEGVLQSLEARDDLVARLHAEFDLEVLAEAEARVRLRVEPHTWEAFQLCAVEDLSGAEVAQRLNLRVATVFKAKSKVQKMLQEEVRRLEGTTDA